MWESKGVSVFVISNICTDTRGPEIELQRGGNGMIEVGVVENILSDIEGGVGGA